MKLGCCYKALGSVKVLAYPFAGLRALQTTATPAIRLPNFGQDRYETLIVAINTGTCINTLIGDIAAVLYEMGEYNR